MTSEEEKPLSFFNKLGKFCSDFESESSALKKDYERQPGLCPMQYYIGMEVIKSEIQQLKKLNDENKDKMSKVYQFDYFVQSMKELLNDQAEDVKAMEEYLERFGYKIPEKDNFAFKIKCLMGKQPDVEINGACEVPDAKHSSPESGEVRKQTVGEQYQHLTVKAGEPTQKFVMGSPSANIEARGNTQVRTPCQRERNRSSCTTPTASAMKRVEHWLEHVEAEGSRSFSVTPQVTNRYKEMNTGKIECYSPCKGSAQDSQQGKEVLVMKSDASPRLRPNDFEVECKTTPDEPFLSAATKNLLHSSVLPQSKNTPEEPSLSVLGTSVINKMVDGDPEQSHTPDEPQLSSLGKTVIEASDAHAQETYTPEEPPLLSQPQPPLPIREKNEDMTGGGQGWRPRNIAGLRPTDPHRQEYPSEGGLRPIPSSSRDPLFSPQLSDITKKILNVKALRFSDSDTTKQNDLDLTTKLDELDNSPKRVISLRHCPSEEPQSPQMSDITLKLLGLK